MKMNDLALFGGDPVRKTPFFTWPRVVDGQQEKLINTLVNDSWGIGSESIRELEDKFALFHEAKSCIAVNTGTNALWVALKAAGVSSGDEVMIPAYTFIATATAVLMANATPVFIDIEPNTFNMDPNLIESAITDRTKVIIPVHIGGNPADMESIIDLAMKHKLIIIEDAAQAHGAEWDGKKVGALHKGGIFSFQSSKNMSAGEGGAIVSNDEDFMDTCFAYYNCGRHRDGDWYEHRIIGGNHRMSAMAASLLIPQFETIENDMRIRDKNRQKLDQALSDMDLEITHRYKKVTRESNHLYLLRYKAENFNNISREKFFDAMRAEGVYTYAGYNPLYREDVFKGQGDDFPWLKNVNYSNISCPITEQIADYQSVWLTQNHLLGDESDIQDIINAFEKVTMALKNYPEKFDN